MDEKILDINSSSWDGSAAQGDRWSTPVTREEIAAARHGEWTVYLTESKPVPRHWFPSDLRGLKVLALASGGGQQGPILTSAGAEVIVLDVSSGQLEQDRLVAERDELQLTTVQGNMTDLSRFADESFDLVFHPTYKLSMTS